MIYYKQLLMHSCLCAAAQRNQKFHSTADTMIHDVGSTLQDKNG